MWVVENSGAAWRAHWEETEDPSLLLSSSYPICRSFLAAVFASLHPGLSPLFLHLVPRFVPGRTFHSLPPQHIHFLHIGLALRWLFLDQANNHTPPRPALVQPALTFSFWAITSQGEDLALQLLGWWSLHFRWKALLETAFLLHSTVVGVLASNAVCLSCPLCNAGSNPLLSPKANHLAGGATSSSSNKMDLKGELLIQKVWVGLGNLHF